MPCNNYSDTVQNDKSLNIYEVGEEAEIFYGSCQAIWIENFEMRSIPWLLTPEQKEKHFSMALDLLEHAETDENFLQKS